MLVSASRVPSISMLAVALSLSFLGCSTPSTAERGHALRPAAHRDRDDVVLAADAGGQPALVSAEPGLLASVDIAEAPFKGKSRKVAKTSIAVDAGELPDVFATVGDLLDELADVSSDNEMEGLGIKNTGDAALRVDQENENVTVTGWLYAAKLEDDQDFHLIIGTDSAGSAIHYINCEISALPAKTKPAYNTLKTARKQFLDLLADKGFGVPTASKYKHYSPPIKVDVSGSLFFDVDHKGGTVGPATRRALTAWELHPITNIALGQQ
jgi:hypothetical protein